MTCRLRQGLANAAVLASGIFYVRESCAVQHIRHVGISHFFVRESCAVQHIKCCPILAPSGIKREEQSRLLRLSYTVKRLHVSLPLCTPFHIGHFWKQYLVQDSVGMCIWQSVSALWLHLMQNFQLRPNLRAYDVPFAHLLPTVLKVCLWVVRLTWSQPMQQAVRKGQQDWWQCVWLEQARCCKDTSGGRGRWRGQRRRRRWGVVCHTTCVLMYVPFLSIWWRSGRKKGLARFTKKDDEVEGQIDAFVAQHVLCNVLMLCSHYAFSQREWTEQTSIHTVFNYQGHLIIMTKQIDFNRRWGNKLPEHVLRFTSVALRTYGQDKMLAGAFYGKCHIGILSRAQDRFRALPSWHILCCLPHQSLGLFISFPLHFYYYVIEKRHIKNSLTFGALDDLWWRAAR